jgi:phospholipid N-methyltransferase
VASIIPSSGTLIRKVASKLDFSKPRVIAEFGPGEGCHTREMLKRMHPDSKLLLFELDPELANHLQKVYRDDHRVFVLNADAATLPQALAERGLQHCDYVISGIPFSIMEPEKKKEMLRATFDSLAPHDDSAFVIYQVTNELRDNGHCNHFPRAESEYCLVNIPPMFVTKFYKTANGHGKNGCCGNHNGNGAH